MVSRGHTLQALLHEYPIDLVLNLHQAAMENQGIELRSQVLGFSVALLNALDSTLGDGKGKILEKWLKAMDGEIKEPGEGQKRRQSAISPATRAFFGNAPVVVKTKE